MNSQSDADNGVILRTHDVSKTFGKFRALKNISASFPRGAITSIIGPNGAGKSTYFLSFPAKAFSTRRTGT